MLSDKVVTRFAISGIFVEFDMVRLLTNQEKPVMPLKIIDACSDSSRFLLVVEMLEYQAGEAYVIIGRMCLDKCIF